MIATNAGGMNVVRFGPMGDQLLDAGVVLADGTYLPSLRDARTDHPAHGLIDLLAGSEGILAIVAHADLTIGPDPPGVAVVTSSWEPREPWEGRDGCGDPCPHKSTG